MADDTRSAAEPDASAALLTVALAGESKNARVDELLDRQVRLAELQIQDLVREDKVRHRNLRIRHISDILKVAFELSVGFIVLAIAVIFAGAMWNAAHEDGLVIEAFNVPPDLANRGLTGQVIAAQLQDKLATMQEQTDSARPAASYSNNWGNDIKVEIPNTGISIGEFYRYLSRWLGDQTHITGDIYRLPDGKIAVTARSGGAGATVVGRETDLDMLMQQAAEGIYARTQPYRYAVFVGNDPNRLQEQIVLLQKLADQGSPTDRLWSHAAISTLMSIATDPIAAVPEQLKGVALAPEFPLNYQNLAGYEAVLDHPEAALNYARRAYELFQNDNGQVSERARAISVPYSEAAIAQLLGDYQAMARAWAQVSQMPDFSGMVEQAPQSIVFADEGLHQHSDAAAMRNAAAAVRAHFANRALAGGLDLLQLQADYAGGHWPAVIAEGLAIDAEFRPVVAKGLVTQKWLDVTLARGVWPYVARAMAMTGDIAGGEAMIAKTPTDCYTCLLNRANIAAVAKDWGNADVWYARAVALAPSIPFAYADWGGMLMAKGDLDAAIAKFEAANEKGPHFADPLEMWGEALLAQKNYSDAANEFEAANEYAPKWGRLHLKWGEALIANGDKNGAVAQFAQAATLDLSAADKAELARDRGVP